MIHADFIRKRSSFCSSSFPLTHSVFPVEHGRAANFTRSGRWTDRIGMDKRGPPPHGPHSPYLSHSAFAHPPRMMIVDAAPAHGWSLDGMAGSRIQMLIMHHGFMETKALRSGSDRRERTVRSVLKGQSVLFYHIHSGHVSLRNDCGRQNRAAEPMDVGLWWERLRV